MNTFGRLFKISIFGESHGPVVGVIVDGCPAGLPLSENDFVDTALFKSFDDSDPARMIAVSLKTQQYAERSRNLAYTVEEEFEKAGRVSRGAKQRDEKGIWVLQAVAMPAILIELGFLSYPDEEAYLMSDQGQQETSETIVKALKRYRYSLSNKQSAPAKPAAQK